MSVMTNKKRKPRKPRKLWDIAVCCVDMDGYRYIRINRTEHPWLIYGLNESNKLAKWFADAAAWLKQEGG